MKSKALGPPQNFPVWLLFTMTVVNLQHDSETPTVCWRVVSEAATRWHHRAGNTNALTVGATSSWLHNVQQ